jgi:hypothetical protein
MKQTSDVDDRELGLGRRNVCVTMAAGVLRFAARAGIKGKLKYCRWNGTECDGLPRLPESRMEWTETQWTMVR